MNADTLSQLQQVTSGHYTNQHDPLLLAVWHPLWGIGVGTGWALAAQVTAVVGGGYLVLRGALSSLAAALGTAVVALSPPVFGMLALIGRDVWFTGALLVAVGALVRVCSSRRLCRATWLIIAMASAWVALAARQNAAFAIVVVSVVLVVVARIPSPAPLRRGTATRVAYDVTAGIVLTLALMGTQRAMGAAVHVRNVHPEQYTYMYDLGGLSEAQHRNLFPADVLPERGMTPIDRYWYVDTVTTLLYLDGSPIHAPLPDSVASDLSHAWRQEVLRHPIAYLSVRSRLWLRQVSITRRAAWIYHPKIDPNSWGLRIRFSSLNNAAKGYVEAFASDSKLDGGIVHTVLIYLVIAFAGVVAFMRRSRPKPLIIAGALCLSALTYQLGLFFGATGLQYRFEFPAVVIGLLAACLFLAQLPRLVRLLHRRPPATALERASGFHRRGC